MILSGFVIGLLGSLHCIGMCGPIALALPIVGNSKVSLIISRLLYNFGRILTYTFFGFIFGLIGNRIKLFGLQQTVSIILGTLIILRLLIPKKISFFQIQFIQMSLTKLKQEFSRIFGKNSMKSLFVIGLLNGFLPCGFVYVGIAGAITTGGPFEGSAFMALFGLGTLPVMFAASLFSSALSLKARLNFRKAIPVFSFLIGILFILRGLNLGIPYISPKMASFQSATEVDCCNPAKK
ncbi:MAG: sulfite exporter TauE/SafE family protein [Ignavibacteriaceae bacterium]|nr:sulfite exporter TauE/SafE family protein [Ignavibacteriaceae bacterium]